MPFLLIAWQHHIALRERQRERERERERMLIFFKIKYLEFYEKI